MISLERATRGHEAISTAGLCAEMGLHTLHQLFPDLRGYCVSSLRAQQQRRISILGALVLLY